MGLQQEKNQFDKTFTAITLKVILKNFSKMKDCTIV